MAYITLKSESRTEMTEKKSVFVGQAKPVTTEKEALDFLNAIKASDRTATHNVFAYRLRDRNFSRYSDDGEPSGTAGLPVLDVLERAGITDAVIVVTRWFGGTLLGTGGLVRAYSASARQAVEAAGLVTMEMAGKYVFTCGYPEYERTARIIGEAGASITSTVYMENVRVEYTANEAQEEAIAVSLKELTRGKSEPVLIETGYLPVG